MLLNLWNLVIPAQEIQAKASGLSFSHEKLSFAVTFKEETSPYKVLGVYVLPGETLEMKIDGVSAEIPFVLQAKFGTTTTLSPQTWKWLAPKKPGFYVVTIKRVDLGETMVLNVFVMVPYSFLKKGYLNGYRIGSYPSVPLNQLKIYDPPLGFVEVTHANRNARVSPHFTLKEFLTKQKSGYPKYLVLQERLLLKLEVILERVNQKGYATPSFFIMSGYRTPFYNRAIGNVKYSRHIWGGAADFFIDVHPKDGRMDDLNRDGKINWRDAKVLYEIIEDLYGRPWYDKFVGGLGWYKTTSAHGPFVHVDVRGFRARWGD